MGDGEGGDDFDDFEQGLAKGRSGGPSLVLALEDAGEKEGNKEKDVVEADPDVPDAFFEKSPEGVVGLGFGWIENEAVDGVGWVEDGGFGALGQVEAQ